MRFTECQIEELTDLEQYAADVASTADAMWELAREAPVSNDIERACREIADKARQIEAYVQRLLGPYEEEQS